jgi:hypothetical protein
MRGGKIHLGDFAAERFSLIPRTVITYADKHDPQFSAGFALGKRQATHRKPRTPTHAGRAKRTMVHN